MSEVHGYPLVIMSGVSPSGTPYIVKVGDDGEINGSDVVVNVDAHEHPIKIFCGMTSSGDIVPFKVNVNGILSLT